MEIEEEDTPEGRITCITETILTAAEQTIPKTKPCLRRTAVPWWSPAVRQAIARRRRSFRKFLRFRTDQNLIIKNRERARTQQIIRRAKRESWQRFLSQLSVSTPLSQIWNLVRRLSGKRCHPSIPIIRNPRNNVTISEPKEVVDTMAHSFAQNSSDNNYAAGFTDTARVTFYTRSADFLSKRLQLFIFTFRVQIGNFFVWQYLGRPR